jgi:hypothetical protein
MLFRGTSGLSEVNIRLSVFTARCLASRFFPRLIFLYGFLVLSVLTAWSTEFFLSKLNTLTVLDEEYR